MAIDYPHISSSGTTSSAYNLGQINQLSNAVKQDLVKQDLANQFAGNNVLVRPNDPFKDEVFRQAKAAMGQDSQSHNDYITKITGILTVKEPQMTRRIVQVYIADTDENIPLDKSLIYSGEQKLTDATDQELFHEIEIARILKEHNEFRTKLINKKVKERNEFLEPARIRDLKMVVVKIAEF